MPKTDSSVSGGPSVAGASTKSDQYLVEKIVSKRYNKERNRFEYLIKWEGYESSENTWEPKDNIYCKDVLDNFEKEHKKQKAIKMEERREAERKRAEISAKKKLARQNRAPGLLISNSESSEEEDRQVLKHVPIKTEKTSKVPKSRSTNERQTHLSSAREVKKEGKTTDALQEGTKKWKAGNNKSKEERKEKDRKTVKPTEVDLFCPTPTPPRKRKIDMITGFDKGFQVEKLVGITKFLGEIKFLVKWRGQENTELIPSRIVSKKCAKMVIQFYEERLIWAPGSSSSASDNFLSGTESEDAGDNDLKVDDKEKENILNLKQTLSPAREENAPTGKPQTMTDEPVASIEREIQKEQICDIVVEVQEPKPEVEVEKVVDAPENGATA